MKNGFTLVELLAVIVILAVLALIATPVVLSIIDDAKESAMLRSAEMYLSGVENAVMRENMNSGGNFRPNECTVSNSNMTCGSTTIEVEVDGEVPSSGSIVFENGKIKEVTLNYETGTIIKDASGMLVYQIDSELSEEELIPALCILAEGTANIVGAKYTCDLGDGEKNFYVLKPGTKSEEVTLILEGNYDTTTQAWCDQNGPNPSNNVCAADGLTAKLDEIASAWTKLERNQIGLPSASDIVVADGKSEDSYTGVPTLSNSWLYSWDNSVWGDTVVGYWTSSINVNIASSVWQVSFNGGVQTADLYLGFLIGVRPIITLKL